MTRIRSRGWEVREAAAGPLTRERWSIVLAAGAGRRLASVTGGIPKQFWSADGGPTLLDETLDRTARLIPASRTVIVVERTHAPFVRPLADAGQHRLVYQPRDKGTAAGVLLGLTEVTALAPNSVVLVTPSDHGIARRDCFLAGIRQVVAHVEAGVSDIVLFGVAPSAPESDYGWIATRNPGRGASQRLGQVTAFVEKPSVHVASRMLAAGAVWNTMVLVARASALLALYRRHLPQLANAFARALDFSESARRDYFSSRYDDLPAADFSRDLLGRATGLSVHTWPASMGWSDLGTPERLERWRESSTPDALEMTPTKEIASAASESSPRGEWVSCERSHASPSRCDMEDPWQAS
jgi:mannose-1-phosphate guanylyltransferase